MGRKAKIFDRELLVKGVCDMRIKGKSTANIIDWLMDKLGMSRPNTYLILREAQDIMNAMNKDSLEDSLRKAVAQLEDEYEKAEGKHRLEIRKELNRIQGLYVERVVHSGEVTMKTNWSDGKADTN